MAICQALRRALWQDPRMKGRSWEAGPKIGLTVCVVSLIHSAGMGGSKARAITVRAK